MLFETSSVKSARRVFTVPFVNAGKFDAVVAAVMGEENPLAAVLLLTGMRRRMRGVCA